ncbi:MAG: SAF domain-containing protein, partial [Verrucomicrobiota bacterium]
MIIIDTKLQEREAQNRPIQVAVIGAGEMSIGLINQIERYTPGMRTAVIYNRTLARAFEAYKTAGVDTVETVSSTAQLDEFIVKGTAAVSDSTQVIFDSEQIDIVVEMTGSIHFAFAATVDAFEAGKSVVTFNAELDSTVGPYLQSIAKAKGVRYTLADGDQPGVTMNLYRYVKGMGFEPLVCGNIKGMLDNYRNPETQKGFAEMSGMSVDMVTSFADGTKVAMEQATIANATGMKVLQRGMRSIEYTGHVEDKAGEFDVDKLRAIGGAVEMIVGAKPGPGVFVYATSDDPVSIRFLEYGKLGKGPLYCFYVPYHLLFFEIPTSIARLVDFGDGTLDALDTLSVEVTTTAKKDLKAGDVLDGIGGFAAYGECENSETFAEEEFLPMGFSRGKKLIRDVAKDTPITWQDVEKTSLDPVEKAY